MKKLPIILLALALAACAGPSPTPRTGVVLRTEPTIRDQSGLVTDTVVLDVRAMSSDQEIEARNADEARLAIDVIWSSVSCQSKPIVEVHDDGIRFSIAVYRGVLADNCTAAEFFRGVRLTLSEPRDANAIHLTVFDPPDPPASFDRG